MSGLYGTRTCQDGPGRTITHSSLMTCAVCAPGADTASRRLLAAEKLAEAVDELRGWCVAMDLPEGPRIAEVKLYRALLAWKEASK